MLGQKREGLLEGSSGWRRELSPTLPSPRLPLPHLLPLQSSLRRRYRHHHRRLLWTVTGAKLAPVRVVLVLVLVREQTIIKMR